MTTVPSAAAPQFGEPTRAVLVGVDVGGAANFDPTLDELALLAESAGDVAVARITARRKAPDAALFVGSGKADEIKAMVAATEAHGVIFDQQLSPVQQRNLEQHLGVPVADRTSLILDIFAQRAQSHEGKLQVELAQLQYLSTRLVRRWSHLERQRGGIGTRGGPGERQIELDRRMIGERIKSVKKRLELVKRQRGTQRKARERRGTFRVSLVGYTNAGKSTLFNALVKAKSYAADQLFATLDTTTRSLWLEQAGTSVSLSDTVGFIRDLPHKLVEAFEATLQEAAEADLLLHVIDGASPQLAEQQADVERVLDEIGAAGIPQVLVYNAEQQAEVERVLEEIGAAGIPQVLVYNKCDLLEAQPRNGVDWIEVHPGLRRPRVFVSAREGLGLDALRGVIADAAAGRLDDATHGLPAPADAALQRSTFA